MCNLKAYSIIRIPNAILNVKISSFGDAVCSRYDSIAITSYIVQFNEKTLE